MNSEIEVIVNEQDAYDKTYHIKYKGYVICEDASYDDEGCMFYSTTVYKDGKQIKHFNREWIQKGIEYVDKLTGGKNK